MHLKGNLLCCGVKKDMPKRINALKTILNSLNYAKLVTTHGFGYCCHPFIFKKEYVQTIEIKNYYYYCMRYNITVKFY